MNKKLFLITDRNPTLGDSISRYIIDLAENASLIERQAFIFTTSESKGYDYILPKSVSFFKGLPDADEDAIFHFHFTFSIREHTKFLLNNLDTLSTKSIVTLHVTPEYAEIMGQNLEMQEILRAISEKNILVHIFSNYSKYDLRRYNVTRSKVIYPGLDLSRYQKFVRHAIKKEKQILIVASNPDSNFVNQVKGFGLIDKIEEKYSGYKIKQIVNMTFNEYLSEMAKSQFYVALSNIEHYGLAIIDAYNLLTIPIYSNEGGLTEAIYGNGVPIFVNGNVVFPSVLEYNNQISQENLAFSQAEHSIKKHITNMNYLYEIIK